MLSIKYRIRVYQSGTANSPYEEWLANLDKPVRARINARIARFEDGHFGDHKQLGGGVCEARFFIGPGYRVYFAVHQGTLILLLTEGDKSSEDQDVKKAKEFFADYLEAQDANKKS